MLLARCPNGSPWSDCRLFPHRGSRLCCVQQAFRPSTGATGVSDVADSLASNPYTSHFMGEPRVAPLPLGFQCPACLPTHLGR